MEFDIKAFWRHKTTLLVCTSIGVALAFCYLALGTPSYLAIARVLVEPQGLAKFEESNSNARVEPELLPTQAETIRSPALISEVLQNVSVTPPRGTDPSKFDAIRHVLKSLTVTPVLKANVLTIAYRSSSTEEAIGLIEGLVVAHRNRIAEMDNQVLKGRIDVAQATEAILLAERDRLTKQYDELRRQSPMLGKGREADAQLLTHLRQLGNELSETRKLRSDLDAKVAIVDGLLTNDYESKTVESPKKGLFHFVSEKRVPIEEVVHKYAKLVDSQDAYALRVLTEDLAKARLEVAQLSMNFGAKHPNMLLAKGEETICEQLVRQRMESITASWYQQLHLLQEAEKSLTAAFEAEERQVKASEDFLVREQHLLDEINKVERLHEPALKQVLSLKSEQEGIASGRQSIHVMIIDSPTIIDEMTWPQPKMLVATCAILGLVVGLGIVLFKEAVLSPSLKLGGLSSGCSQKREPDPAGCLPNHRRDSEDRDWSSDESLYSDYRDISNQRIEVLG